MDTEAPLCFHATDEASLFSNLVLWPKETGFKKNLSAYISLALTVVFLNFIWCNKIVLELFYSSAVNIMNRKSYQCFKPGGLCNLKVQCTDIKSNFKEIWLIRSVARSFDTYPPTTKLFIYLLYFPHFYTTHLPRSSRCYVWFLPIFCPQCLLLWAH